MAVGSVLPFSGRVSVDDRWLPGVLDHLLVLVRAAFYVAAVILGDLEEESDG